MTEFEPIFDTLGIPTDKYRQHEDWGDATKFGGRTPVSTNSASNISATGPTIQYAELTSFAEGAHQCRVEHFDALMRGDEVLAECFAVDDNLNVALHSQKLDTGRVYGLRRAVALVWQESVMTLSSRKA